LELTLRDFYEVGEKLGSGSFATVHVVRHKCHDQQAIMKAITKVYAPSTYQQHLVDGGLFETFLSMSREQPHDNVVRYFDFLESPERYYAVVELLEGLPLKEVLTRKDLVWTQRQSAGAMHDILRALQHLHTVVGIYHRDLKLEHLRYRCKSVTPTVSDTQEWKPFGDLVLFDFGLARFVDQEWDGAFTGTKMYLAPEVSKELVSASSFRSSTGGYSPAVDLWAAGVVLYALLAGDFPFDEDDVEEEDCSAIAEKSIQDLDDRAARKGYSIPRKLLEGLLNPDPAHRLDASSALEDSWIVRSSDLETDSSSKSTICPWAVDESDARDLESEQSKVLFADDANHGMGITPKKGDTPSFRNSAYSAYSRQLSHINEDALVARRKDAINF
jgi:serine/threonine protein kinase